MTGDGSNRLPFALPRLGPTLTVWRAQIDALLLRDEGELR